MKVWYKLSQADYTQMVVDKFKTIANLPKLKPSDEATLPLSPWLPAEPSRLPPAPIPPNGEAPKGEAFPSSLHSP